MSVRIPVEWEIRTSGWSRYRIKNVDMLITEKDADRLKRYLKMGRIRCI